MVRYPRRAQMSAVAAATLSVRGSGFAVGAYGVETALRSSPRIASAERKSFTGPLGSSRILLGPSRPDHLAMSRPLVRPSRVDHLDCFTELRQVTDEVAVGVGPVVPDRDAVVFQIFNVGLAPQEPEQFMHDRPEGKPLGGQHRKARCEIEAHLMAEDRQRAGARAVALLHAVLENVL